MLLVVVVLAAFDRFLYKHLRAHFVLPSAIAPPWSESPANSNLGRSVCGLKKLDITLLPLVIDVHQQTAVNAE